MKRGHTSQSNECSVTIKHRRLSPQSIAGPSTGGDLLQCRTKGTKMKHRGRNKSSIFHHPESRIKSKSDSNISGLQVSESTSPNDSAQKRTGYFMSSSHSTMKSSPECKSFIRVADDRVPFQLLLLMARLSKTSSNNLIPFL